MGKQNINNTLNINVNMEGNQDTLILIIKYLWVMGPVWHLLIYAVLNGISSGKLSLNA